MTDLFQSKEEMSPMGVATQERLATAVTREQMHDNYAPAMNDRVKNANVQNVMRPRRGHGY